MWWRQQDQQKTIQLTMVMKFALSADTIVGIDQAFVRFAARFPENLD
jgi:hypothetical protein